MSKEALPTTFIPGPEDSVTCRICQRACNLTDGAVGYCSGYKAEDGTLIDLTYGKITTAQVTELGWAPVSEFADPEDEILSVGSRGCNFRCNHCINYTHAFARHDERDSTFVSPASLVEYANLMSCKGIAANFNEGLLALAYWKDIFQLAKEHNLYTIAVTNGYATPEALDEICPYLDVYRCDIKALHENTMSSQGNRGIRPEGVLESLLHVKHNFPNTHIETVTMISPGINDHPQELHKIAGWIHDNLGPDTPWHISPMDPVETTRRVPPPDYVESAQLNQSDRYTGFSISFDDSGAFLQVGNSDLLSITPSAVPHEFLEEISHIGHDAGLTRVIIKTDGH